MSALLVDDLMIAAPSRERSQWQRVRPSRGRVVQFPLVEAPLVPDAPTVEPVAAPRPDKAASRPRSATVPIGIALGDWQLTARGLAVLMGIFLGVVAVAAVVLIGGFLAVSDAPVIEEPGLAQLAVQQG